MATYSLSQKRMMAKMAGESKVVLTLEEADAALATIDKLNEQIVKYMAYVPDDVLKAEADEMYKEHR